jgi:hypothetical protein
MSELREAVHQTYYDINVFWKKHRNHFTHFWRTLDSAGKIQMIANIHVKMTEFSNEIAADDPLTSDLSEKMLMQKKGLELLDMMTVVTTHTVYILNRDLLETTLEIVLEIHVSSIAHALRGL